MPVQVPVVVITQALTAGAINSLYEYHGPALLLPKIPTQSRISWQSILIIRFIINANCSIGREVEKASGFYSAVKILLGAWHPNQVVAL